MKIEMGVAITFFIKREQYKVALRHAIKKYGISSLPKVILDTIPVGTETLHELPWYLNIQVLVRIVQISILRAQTEAFRRAINA